ncbi:hypothetical protein MTO96_049130 [Rhipicephalus appendiculatus]
MAATVHVAEYVVFGVLMLSNLLVGLYFSFGRRSRDGGTSEAFLGDRSLGTLPLSLSVLASLVTAVGVVGLTAHFYRYGLHLLWGSLTVFCLVPFIARVVVPVIYRLRVTSVFEYLRLRFGNKVGGTACACYFVLNQMQGAISIFAAGVTVAMSFHLPLAWSCVAIGFAGTIYTALGGLRAVVWADAVQGVLILICPLTILVKILYDSIFDVTADASVARRPFGDIDMRPYLFRTSLDFTSDENVWACSVGLLASHIYRVAMDQMVVQRYAAARSLPEAQRTVLAGSVLLVVSTGFLGSGGHGSGLLVPRLRSHSIWHHPQDRTGNPALRAHEAFRHSWLLGALSHWRRERHAQYSDVSREFPRGYHLRGHDGPVHEDSGTLGQHDHQRTRLCLRTVDDSSGAGYPVYWFSSAGVYGYAQQHFRTIRRRLSAGAGIPMGQYKGRRGVCVSHYGLPTVGDDGQAVQWRPTTCHGGDARPLPWERYRAGRHRRIEDGSRCSRHQA